MWAEKEFRNLSRIHQAGIPSPEPLHLKLHVLVMRLIGGGGWAAPRLKDAAIDEATMTQLYWVIYPTWTIELVISTRRQDCARYMRIMFEQCRLVHGDLSEYNILYHENRLYIIDVSQSVEHDHPLSLEFLRKVNMALFSSQYPESRTGCP